MILMYKGRQVSGECDSALPPGGTTGQILAKSTDANYDTKWVDIPEDRGEVYSTEETRIGTWIDGKPLYRKIIQCKTPSTTDSWQTISPIIPHANVHSVVSGVIGDGFYYDPVPILSLGGIVLKLHYDSENSTILPPGLNGYCANHDYINKDIIVTLLYTKTTD